ncbi:hypothetical protein ACT691_06500 [Vibrio metschnikovii]
MDNSQRADSNSATRIAGTSSTVNPPQSKDIIEKYSESKMAYAKAMFMPSRMQLLQTELGRYPAS